MGAKARRERPGSTRAMRCGVRTAALLLWLGFAANSALGSPTPSGAAAAAPPSTAPPHVDPAPASPAAPPVSPPVTESVAGLCAPSPAGVTKAYREVEEKIAAPAGATSSVQRAHSADIGLGEVLTVEVPGLPQLLKELAAPSCKGKQLVLYLDDRPLPDLAAFPPADPAGSILRFTLKRTEKSRDAWALLLGRPTWSPRETRVSIGLADGYAYPSDAAPVELAVIPQGRFTFWALLLGLMLIAFFVLAARSELLRDSAPPPPGGTARRPFSLARSQAAWWFFLVLASYLFIGLITGDFGTSITGTVLALLGISAGTAVGSAAVDASKSTPLDQANRVLTATLLEGQVQQVQARMVNPLQADSPPVLAAALQEKLSQLKVVRNETESFILDILSDANGVNFHRFQMAAWTVVLGIIFVREVYYNLAMPTFDGSLLALMGISAGTYLGMKIPEPKLPTPTP